MSFSARLSARPWLLALLCAAGFVGWTGYERARRVVAVTNTDREEVRVDAASPTGYVGGRRWLIVPEHNNRSYQWIAETQQMLARGDWRVRQVDYENAPEGRAVHSASPYRWWLGLLAWCDHAVSGQPLGLAVERAALWAGPLLHLLLLTGTTLFVARQFGSLPAALLAAGLAAVFPFAGGFLPGVPDDHGLARACALWSVLPLLVRTSEARRAHLMFLLAGVAGGVGLWVSATGQAVVIVGIAVGGIAAACLGRRDSPASQTGPAAIMPWRTWALAGAITSLLAYLVEYFPGHLDLRLQVNHPIHGVTWLGVGELMAVFEAWTGQRKSFWSLRRAGRLVFALAAVAAMPVALKVSATPPLLSGDPYASRLDWLPNGVVAPSFSAWFARDGLTGTVAATCLPLLLLGPAVWLLFRRQTGHGGRTALAVGLGPVVVSLILACQQLRWWNLCDAMLLALLVAITAAGSFRRRWLWPGFAVLIFLPGVIQLVPPAAQGKDFAFTRLEIEGLVERSLAHWIADHAAPDGAVILVPPDRTVSWCFHGGLRGIGTANWENRDGLAATVRIVTATTADEAQALLNQHNVSHIILPSWDTDLDQFAGWTLRNPEDAFIMALHHWALPPWLRPLPYKLPANVGFDDQSVAILRVTDDTSRPAAAARLAEYFIESGQMENAVSAIQSLQRYPTDLGALAALAQVERARNNAAGFTQALDTMLSSLAAGTDRALAWDRRVSLAVVLAQGERNDLAREQVKRCLDKLGADQLRSLTTGSLYRLLVLSKAFDLPIADPALRDLARKLLPAELRRRL